MYLIESALSTVQVGGRIAFFGFIHSLHNTMDSVLALHPAALGLIPGVPKNFSEFLMLPRLIDGVAA